MAIKIAMKDG